MVHRLQRDSPAKEAARFSAFMKDQWAEGAGELGKHMRTDGGVYAPWLKVRTRHSREGFSLFVAVCIWRASSSKKADSLSVFQIDAPVFSEGFEKGFANGSPVLFPLDTSSPLSLPAGFTPGVLRLLGHEGAASGGGHKRLPVLGDPHQHQAATKREPFRR